ncbi:unnamed protein product [Spirodela intermedia]|uniref:Uncharacterized protein n=1 Tax=Spirodela intermedia TaxID=51605 RepID=A0A7I8I964_SPIIN|nr:unnamed protein product [Spirodela intermedia]CAA6653451.1 unnamed protein product [Spirodela intermedia]
MQCSWTLMSVRMNLSFHRNLYSITIKLITGYHYPFVPIRQLLRWPITLKISSHP